MKKSISNFKNLKASDVWNAENIYHLKTNTTRISKLIYHYEIYKKIINIPGDVVECGVFKGISFTRFLTFRSILENNFSRKIIGFDAFGKFPKQRNKNDKKFIKKWESFAGNGISKNELNSILIKKNFQNYELVQGDVVKTIPSFLKKSGTKKIALLHLDMDVYEPTKFVLNKLFRKMSSNGIILIDDYSVIPGATKAIDEFLKTKKNLKLEKLSYYKLPSYIVVK